MFIAVFAWSANVIIRLFICVQEEHNVTKTSFVFNERKGNKG